MRASRPHHPKGWLGILGAAVAVAAATAPASGEIRVQDIARLQGRHANRLFGYGLVVGLDGTGDGPKSPSTLRALMQLHRAYHAPVFDLEELAANNNVAIVAVEATIPDYGARSGQRVDVVVSALGPADSLRGGQLLTTPMQEATLAIPNILALAGGPIEIDESEGQVRGVIRGGAVLEEDIYYAFIENGAIHLVLDETKAGFQWAHMLARSINIEVQSFARPGESAVPNAQRIVASSPLAIAVGPTSVRVQVPQAYRNNPAQFISTVMTASVIEEPRQQARVVINRRTNSISFSGSVSISATVLQIPGLGTVSVGGQEGGPGAAPESAPTSSVAGIDTQQTGDVEFQELLNALGRLQLSDKQMVDAVEQLHRTGTLHAELVYAE